jgi:peroxiredoxin
MKAWGEKMEFGEKIELLADPVGSFSEKLGILRSHGSILGHRATRSAMVVENGIVQHMFVEEKGKFEISKAENVLSHL